MKKRINSTNQKDLSARQAISEGDRSEQILKKYEQAIDKIDVPPKCLVNWSLHLKRRVNVIEKKRKGNTTYYLLETFDHENETPPHYYKCLEHTGDPQSLGEDRGMALQLFRSEIN